MRVAGADQLDLRRFCAKCVSAEKSRTRWPDGLYPDKADAMGSGARVPVRANRAENSFMDSLNLLSPAFDRAAIPEVVRAFEDMPASALIGLETLGLRADGEVGIALPVRTEITYDGRSVQGGVVGLLADYAGIGAVWSRLPPGWRAATTGFELHNLARANGEKLVAIGKVEHVGKTHAVASVRVWSVSGADATLAAVATVTARPFESHGPRARADAPGDVSAS